jgi:hypothetical protein
MTAVGPAGDIAAAPILGDLHEGTAHRTVYQNDASHRLTNRSERHMGMETMNGAP